MKALWDAILKDALPTKWSRLIAGAIPTLMISVVALPVSLQKLGVSLSPQIAQFLRTIAPLLILSLGLIVLLIYIVYQYRNSRLTSEQFKGYKEIKVNKGAIVCVKIGEENSEIYYCPHCFHSQVLTPLQPSTQIGSFECRRGHGLFPI